METTIHDAKSIQVNTRTVESLEDKYSVTNIKIDNNRIVVFGSDDIKVTIQDERFNMISEEIEFIYSLINKSYKRLGIGLDLLGEDIAEDEIINASYAIKELEKLKQLLEVLNNIKE